MTETYKHLERLVVVIDLFLAHDGAKKLSGTLIDDEAGGPPIYHAHVLLDGHEFMVSIIPTDLDTESEHTNGA